MLLRDAQEQVRILYAAKRNAVRGQGDLLSAHVREATTTLGVIQPDRGEEWKGRVADPDRFAGLLLLVAFAISNELKVDAHAAFENVLREECP